MSCAPRLHVHRPDEASGEEPQPSGVGAGDGGVLVNKDRYGAAVHEAGHAVAACSMGLGMKQRGIVISDKSGITYNRAPGFNSRRRDRRCG